MPGAGSTKLPERGFAEAGQQFRKYASAMIATAIAHTVTNRCIFPTSTAGTAEKSIPQASQYGA
jgi:hypothetical protein